MDAQTIIKAALRKIGALRRGFTLSAEDTADGLEALNLLVDSFGNENLLIPFRTRETLTLTPGINPHTIGSGGTFNTVRPIEIESVVLVYGSTDYPLERWPYNRYAWLDVKSRSRRPEAFYYEPSDPLARLYFDFVPDSAYTLRVDSLKPIVSFATLTTEDSLPGETIRFLVFNLAVDLAPEYNREVPQTVAAIAADTKAKFRAKTIASRVPAVAVDNALLRRPTGPDILNPR